MDENRYYDDDSSATTLLPMDGNNKKKKHKIIIIVYTRAFSTGVYRVLTESSHGAKLYFTTLLPITASHHERL